MHTSKRSYIWSHIYLEHMTLVEPVLLLGAPESCAVGLTHRELSVDAVHAHLEAVEQRVVQNAPLHTRISTMNTLACQRVGGTTRAGQLLAHSIGWRCA
jgi:hypothetical protein